MFSVNLKSKHQELYEKPLNYKINVHDVLNAVCYMELQVCFKLRQM